MCPFPVELTRRLRRDVLRPAETVAGQAQHEPPGALAAAVLLRGRPVSVGLIGREDRSGACRPAAERGRWWRVRAMATAPGHRGRGYGSSVLAALLAHARAAGGAGVWCSARVPAQAFYEAAGFRAVSDVYEVADIGPHLAMELALRGGWSADGRPAGADDRPSGGAA